MKPVEIQFPEACPDERLILVYDADQGMLAALANLVRRFLRPDDYSCSLFQLSYGTFAMRSKWRQFLGALPIEKQIFHRQKFARAFPLSRYPELTNLQLPAILIEDGGQLELLLGAMELDQLASVEELIWVTEQALQMRLATTA